MADLGHRKLTSKIQFIRVGEVVGAVLAGEDSDVVVGEVRYFRHN